MMRAARFCAVFAACVVGGVVVGCPFLPDHDRGAGLADRDVLVAFAADFDGYERWPHVVVGTGAIDGGHNADAPRTAYVNALPADDATTWPVGTIIVKEGSGKETEGATGTQTHAMVKRGGGFNQDGADGWEFFELKRAAGGALVLAWRGAHPPDGESYGCIAGNCEEGFGDCNGCHASARDNDFVLSPPLTLGNIDQSLLAP